MMSCVWLAEVRAEKFIELAIYLKNKGKKIQWQMILHSRTIISRLQ